MNEKKSVVIIDGQGGRIGAKLCESIKKSYGDRVEITAVGTNTSATEAMLRAGADLAATGENAASAACRKADVISGPIGIVIADSLLGEITPRIAFSVARSSAVRVLIPMNRCNNFIAGVGGQPLSALEKQAVEEIGKILF